ncbi:hypothetical protein AVEN_32503-1 [Araneus ventricosus]|uniref:Uncharacterized protein n=1 Tax=Araneus ventricosus TaxID=182803 RepID=A0A4Y2VRP9_ARAVE|nr:hypothetical protein AVEN_32503-1 [Araneus ventricosus]
MGGVDGFEASVNYIHPIQPSSKNLPNYSSSGTHHLSFPLITYIYAIPSNPQLTVRLRVIGGTWCRCRSDTGKVKGTVHGVEVLKQSQGREYCIVGLLSIFSQAGAVDPKARHGSQHHLGPSAIGFGVHWLGFGWGSIVWLQEGLERRRDGL